VVRWWAVASIGYLILYVRDVDVSAAFYRDVVGLPLKLRDAGYAEVVTGGRRFGLLERTRASDLIHREPTEGGPAGEVLFLVDDVDAEAERLRALGVELLSGPVDRRWGHRTLHLLDPDGFVVELAQKIPRLAPRHG
jgi:lactoylglutathione lyase